MALFAAPALAAPALAAVDDAQLAAADKLFKGSKPVEAQAAYEAILKADPTHYTATVRLGVLALRRDDTDTAIAMLEKAMQLDPKQSETERQLGDAYGRAAQKKGIFGGLGLGKKCLAAYQKAVELDPKNINAHGSLFDFYRQAPGLAGGSMEKAAAHAAEMKKLDPLRGRIAFATLYAADKKYDKAFAEFDEVLKVNPDDFSALYQLGRLAAMTGEFVDRGLAALRRAIELPLPENYQGPGKAAAHWRLGNLLEKKKDPAGARGAYETALTLDPNFAPAADSLKKLK